ncbi:MAG TPA: ABC transporter permease [Acidimicrobiales bacterium]|jgi:ABC-2 type transport system permease protein/oleandomycin transport system permease protein
MTTTTQTAAVETRAPADNAPWRPDGGSRLGWAIADTFTVVRRNLIVYTRIPEFLFFSTVQPIMFVLLFRYVFGGAIHPPGGGPYVDYLMAGIFVQSVAFGSISTAVGLSEDLQKGLLERFRALPMARAAVLTGRTTADLCRNIFVVGVITGVGYAVGFRIGAGVPAFLAGIALILFFAYAMSWGFAVIGLSAPNSETAQVMAFPILFPLVFASPAFVGVNSMPSWLRDFATHQPIGVVVIATRALTEGGPTATPVFQALLWCVGLLIVFVPLAVRQYRRRA